MNEIISLGCGGGRHQTLDQSFRTGGFRIHSGVKLHVDPGPGALLLTNELGLNPLEVDGVIVSHTHSDHYADAEILVEAMERESSGGGRFIGSVSTIEGAGDLGPALSKYHRREAGEVISLEPGESFKHGALKLEATPTEHGDPTGIGLKIHDEPGIVGYTGDTQYFEGLPELFENSRVLIANVTRPGDKRIEGHLCSDDLIKMLKEIKPEAAMILHMGMLFLRNSPEKEAGYIEEQTGVRTVPGHVGTRVKVGEEVKIRQEPKQTEIAKFS